MNKAFWKGLALAIILDILANFLFLWVFGFAMPIWLGMLVGGFSGVVCVWWFECKYF